MLVLTKIVVGIQFPQPYQKHSHKKWKNSLEGTLDRLLFPVELEFPKILVPRIPQHTSNVNTVRAGKTEWSKQLHYFYVNSFFEH